MALRTVAAAQQMRKPLQQRRRLPFAAVSGDVE